MTCPDCKGTGKLVGIGCPGFKVVELPCMMCDCTGQVTEEQAQWIAAGRKMHELRVSRGMSLREAAKRRGILPSILSDMERGIVKPEVES